MDQDTAYKMIQAYAKAGVSCHMQRTTEATWDVILDDRRLGGIVTIHNVIAGRAEWRRCQGLGLIPA